MKRFDVIYEKIKFMESPVGVEIGVCDGPTSIGLLELHSGLILYSIDPYITYPVCYDVDKEADQINRPSQKDFDEQYKRVRLKLAHFGWRSCFVRATSENGAKNFISGYFDFVFIDGNHFYESVKQDIALWLPKIKTGGYLFGHDYDLNEPYMISNVVKAVDDSFPQGVNYESDTVWWVRK